MSSQPLDLASRPLHVRVAEVLGWTGIYLAGNFMVPDSDLYMGKKPGEMIVGREGLSGVPRYDLSWSATGPLIERFGINLARTRKHYIASYTTKEEGLVGCEEGANPRLAVCNLIVANPAHFSIDKQA